MMHSRLEIFVLVKRDEGFDGGRVECLPTVDGLHYYLPLPRDGGLPIKVGKRSRSATIEDRLGRKERQQWLRRGKRGELEWHGPEAQRIPIGPTSWVVCLGWDSAPSWIRDMLSEGEHTTVRKMLVAAEVDLRDRALSHAHPKTREPKSGSADESGDPRVPVRWPPRAALLLGTVVLLPVLCGIAFLLLSGPPHSCPCEHADPCAILRQTGRPAAAGYCDMATADVGRDDRFRRVWLPLAGAAADDLCGEEAAARGRRDGWGEVFANLYARHLLLATDGEAGDRPVLDALAPYTAGSDHLPSAAWVASGLDGSARWRQVAAEGELEAEDAVRELFAGREILPAIDAQLRSTGLDRPSLAPLAPPPPVWGAEDDRREDPGDEGRDEDVDEDEDVEIGGDEGGDEGDGGDPEDAEDEAGERERSTGEPDDGTLSDAG